MPEQPEIVLGFVSQLCAGKDTALAYFQNKHGFYSSSLSDRIREELVRQGKEITRDSLQRVAGEMREKFGPMVLAERTWADVLNHNSKKAIVGSLRGTEEVEFFRKQTPSFHLIFIDADEKIRFERMVARSKATGRKDPVTWEEFNGMMQREQYGDGRNIPATIKMADFTVENNGTLEEFEKKLDELLKQLKVS